MSGLWTLDRRVLVGLEKNAFLLRVFERKLLLEWTVFHFITAHCEKTAGSTYRSTWPFHTKLWIF